MSGTLQRFRSTVPRRRSYWASRVFLHRSSEGILSENGDAANPRPRPQPIRWLSGWRTWTGRSSGRTSRGQFSPLSHSFRVIQHVLLPIACPGREHELTAGSSRVLFKLFHQFGRDGNFTLLPAFRGEAEVELRSHANSACRKLRGRHHPAATSPVGG